MYILFTLFLRSNYKIKPNKLNTTVEWIVTLVPFQPKPPHIQLNPVRSCSMFQHVLYLSVNRVKKDAAKYKIKLFIFLSICLVGKEKIYFCC